MMITLTRTAAAKAKSLLEKTGRPDAALRVRILSGGCSGLEYKLVPDFEAPKEDDDVLEQGGMKILVDKQSALYLKGTEVDYVSSLMGSGFKFKNPNAVAECSCGESFTV